MICNIPTLISFIFSPKLEFSIVTQRFKKILARNSNYRFNSNKKCKTVFFKTKKILLVYFHLLL